MSDTEEIQEENEVSADPPPDETPAEENNDAEGADVSVENGINEQKDETAEEVEVPMEEEQSTEDAEKSKADEILEIRNEDEGRPISSLSKKSVSFTGVAADTGSEDKTSGGLAKLLRGMWASREMLNESTDKQVVMKTTLRELILYCVFLFVIVYMTFSQYSTDFFVLRSRIESLFEHQPKVTTASQFWQFMEEDVMKGLYWEELYNKGRKTTQFRCPSTGVLANEPCPVPYTDRNMMYENRMLGVPRMRQIKVHETSCDIYEDFKSAIKKCYAPYEEAFEDKKSYIPEHRKGSEINIAANHI